MGQAVIHFEIMGRDGARLRSFYQELFSWAIDADNPFDYGVVGPEPTLDGEGTGIGGGIGATQGEQPPHVTLYVEVSDVEDSLARAEQLGGTRLMGPEAIMEGVEIGLFHDLDGNMIGVIKGRP